MKKRDAMELEDALDTGAKADFAAVIGTRPVAPAPPPEMTRGEKKRRYLDEPFFGKEEWKGHTKSPL